MEMFNEMMRRENALKKVFVTEYKRIQWRPALGVLGILSDKKIARKMGVTTPCVARVRTLLGIAPVSFPKLCERYGAEFKGYLYMV